MGKLILVTGGARSGKSAYALRVAEAVSERKLFVATSPHLDQEMSDRITRHQEERRGRDWQTIEEETKLANIFSSNVQNIDVVLIDCITLWVNNIIYAVGEHNINDKSIGELCQEWIERALEYPGVVICVTNEVGMGIVPENDLARKYRDLVGTCNQILGKVASEVVLVSCGIPLTIKNENQT